MLSLMNDRNTILEAWQKLPSVVRIVLIVVSIFMAGVTTYAAAADQLSLPARVSALEQSDASQTTMLRFLVCRARTENQEGCEFILEDSGEAGYDASVR